MIRAFTLVEVLVVMGILAVLIVLAVPAVRSVQARGNSAKCLGNLRQIGVGLNAYLAENDQRMPALAAGRASRDEDLPVLDTVFAEYLGGSRAVFACPADRQLAARTGTSYYWNVALNDQATGSLNFLKIFEAKSSIPVVSDKEGWHTGQKRRVNILFADGHAGKDLVLTAQP